MVTESVWDGVSHDGFEVFVHGRIVDVRIGASLHVDRRFNLIEETLRSGAQ